MYDWVLWAMDTTTMMSSGQFAIKYVQVLMIGATVSAIVAFILLAIHFSKRKE